MSEEPNNPGQSAIMNQRNLTGPIGSDPFRGLVIMSAGGTAALLSVFGMMFLSATVFLAGVVVYGVLLYVDLWGDEPRTQSLERRARAARRSVDETAYCVQVEADDGERGGEEESEPREKARGD